MMKHLQALGWWTAWAGFAGYRAWQVFNMMAGGNWLGWLLFGPEAIALYFGVKNAFVASSRDYSLIGLWVPFCYAAGIFVISGQKVQTSMFATSLFVLAELLSVWALLCLRERFSVAGGAWVSLCERGPYRFIRHPQLAARVLFVVACTLSAGDPAGFVVGTLLTVSVVLVEERHLSLQGEYRQYAQRVRYRLLPGVF